MNLLEPELACEVYIAFDAALIPSLHMDKLIEANQDTRGKIALGIVQCGLEVARRYGVGLSVSDSAGQTIRLVEEAE